MCSTSYGISDEAKFLSIQKLLARTPGRHTAYAEQALGRMHSRGLGTPVDGAEAVKWTKMAAERLPVTNGVAEAQYCLGAFYYEGKANLKIDDSEAFKWFKRAADNGLVIACAGDDVLSLPLLQLIIAPTVSPCVCVCVCVLLGRGRENGGGGEEGFLIGGDSLAKRRV
jgi:TPR repeat protein